MQEETLRRKIRNLQERRKQIEEKVKKLHEMIRDVDRHIRKNRYLLDTKRERRAENINRCRIDKILDTTSKQLKEV